MRAHRHLPLLPLLLTTNVLAQQPPSTPIAGQVTSREPGERGIHLHARAKVYLYEQDYGDVRVRLLRSGVTDAAGKFRFEGFRRLTAAERGMRFRFLVCDVANRSVTLQSLRGDNIKLDQLRIRVQEPFALEGIVRGADGKPLPGARVWVQQCGAPAPGVHLSGPIPELHTRTDPQGRWQLRRLPRGVRLTLVADAPMHVAKRIYIREKVHPGPTGFALEAAGAISGRVLGLDGRPRSGILVRAQGCSGFRVTGGFARSDPKGRYTIHGITGGGQYNLWAKFPGLTTKARERVEVETGEVTANQDLHALKGHWIHGVVLDAKTGKPIRPSPRSDVGMYGPARPRSSAAIEHATIQDDGTFKILAPPGVAYLYLRTATDKWRPASAAQHIKVEGQDVKGIEFLAAQTAKKNP